MTACDRSVTACDPMHTLSTAAVLMAVTHRHVMMNGDPSWDKHGTKPTCN